jgi:peptidyl-prolyl cis-trans isomerase SurA
MRLRFQLAVLWLLAGLGLAQAQVVDRMVAVVNRRVILESELDQALRVEFLLQGRPIASLTPADRAAVLDRLIERALLEQQIINPAMVDPTPQELAAKVKEVRDGMAAAGGASAIEDAQWNGVLSSYGLTQQDMEEQLASQVRILRFIDLRFRGLVRVDKSDIEAYYQEKFLPEVRKRNAAEPRLAEVSGRIEQVLVEQRIDGLLSDWLKTLRAQAHIEKMLPAPAAPATGATP